MDKTRALSRVFAKNLICSRRSRIESKKVFEQALFSRATLTSFSTTLLQRHPSRSVHLPPTITELCNTAKAGDEIQIRGWIRKIRKMKEVSFLDVSDGSSLSHFQVVVTPQQIETQKLANGACVEIHGKVVESPGRNQSFELSPSKISVLGAANQESNPLQPKQHSFEFLREIAHLRPRTNFFGAMFRLRNTATMSIHNFFQENGFMQVHTPIITPNDCEGGGEAFSVTVKPEKTNSLKDLEGSFKEFFNREAYLTVSGQLDAEIMATALSRVYTFGPTFRAERQSHTTRHLAEFWMLEPEIAFANLDTCIELSELMVKRIIKDLLEKSHSDMEFFNKWVDKSAIQRLKDTLESKFERITYTDAITLLEKHNSSFQFPVQFGSDLQREHEKFLCETHFKKPVFVTDWPKEIKAFYMKQNDDGKTVSAMDLLVPEVGELIGGSAREDRHDVLLETFKRMNINQQGELDWYLDLRKYGSVPHAGFGMGFERLLMFATGAKNIKDVIPIPRYKGYCSF